LEGVPKIDCKSGKGVGKTGVFPWRKVGKPRGFTGANIICDGGGWIKLKNINLIYLKLKSTSGLKAPSSKGGQYEYDHQVRITPLHKSLKSAIILASRAY